MLDRVVKVGEGDRANAEDSKKITQQAILEIDLMNLPDSLRKTMLIIAKRGLATPEEVA